MIIFAGYGMWNEIIDLSLHEFMTLPEDEWQKEYFSFETGGYVATHVLKAKDDNRSYRSLLKFKAGALRPRGYPDAYFDGQTWDFKTSSFTNEDSLRHSYKAGRKADNLVFIINEPKQVVKLRIAIEREFGRRMRDQTWQEFPNVYYLFENQIIAIFNMYKKRQI